MYNRDKEQCSGADLALGIGIDNSLGPLEAKGQLKMLIIYILND